MAVTWNLSGCLKRTLASISLKAKHIISWNPTYSRDFPALLINKSEFLLRKWEKKIIVGLPSFWNIPHPLPAQDLFYNIYSLPTWGFWSWDPEHQAQSDSEWLSIAMKTRHQPQSLLMGLVSVRVRTTEPFFCYVWVIWDWPETPLQKGKSQPGLQRSYQLIHENRSWVDLHRKT